MQTILDCMKPKLEITKKRESSAEYPISCERKFEVGESINVRNYVGKQKWINGVIQEKIGTKLYRINIGETGIVRHIYQLLKEGNYDKSDNWYDYIETPNSDELDSLPEVRRYP